MAVEVALDLEGGAGGCWKEALLESLDKMVAEGGLPRPGGPKEET